jgi:hypothetical protein
MINYRAAAAAVGILLALTACSKGQVATPTHPNSGPGTSTQAQLVSLLEGARSKATAEKTAHFTQTIVVTPASGAAQTFSINGAMDVPNHRIGMTFNLPGLGAMEGVLDGTIIYEKIPQMAAMLGGKPWFKIDPASLRNAAGGGQFAPLLSSLDTLLKQAESQDPTSGLSLLAGVSGPVTTAGPDTVRGVATTHYRFEVDSAKALAKLPADAQAAIQSFVAQLGITTTPMEAWIDAEGRIRKIHATVDTSKAAASPFPLPSGMPATGLPKSTEVTMELFDYGAPVSITVPPADQVTDLGAALSQKGGSE